MSLRKIPLLLLAAGLLLLPVAAFAQAGPRVTAAPPELPAYDQPDCPGDGYIWTPGYWAWDGGYYWVPGTWVMAPEPGYLWTPGYWGWGDGGYFFNDGYWGPSVGFYGGINYGFGYFGHGYEGGRWENGHFFYNTSLNRVGANFHNVYNTRVESPGNRVSYNGGNGGVSGRASAEEQNAARGRHAGPTSDQTQHVYAARNNTQQKFSSNHGTPSVAATSRATTAVHPQELPPVQVPQSKTGNAKLDQQNERQQANVISKQNRERQQLQQTQDKEHKTAARQATHPANLPQVEQKHQQQTQQMQQQHVQQIQQMPQRQPSGGGGARGRHG